jgi:uracil-DNA glycosylase family 4
MPIIERCRDCPYAGKAVGPRGNTASRIVLVGEAPGATEIVEKEPFRGPAGAVLRKALADAGLSEADVFITNSVACRPYNPGRSNLRTPSPDAIVACHERLVRDIEANPGAVIVALGRTAVRAVTGQLGFLITTKKPGTELPSKWGTVVPMLHPAFVLRFPTKWYPVLVKDLKHARRLAVRAGGLAQPR